MISNSITGFGSDLPLSEALVERVLTELDFTQRPAPTMDGLRPLYAAWCQRVPFDNLRKMIHARAADPGPFPGSTPEDFLEAWLKYRTGGTCWSGNGAFHALLTALGFPAVRAVATMLAAPNIPPNHGSVQVVFGDERYIVDCSMLHVEPLRLDEHTATSVEHPAWGLRCEPREDRWYVSWRPMHKVDGFECRYERFGASAEDFRESYERTRGWSPFNYELSARLNRGNEVVGASFGHAVTLHADGHVSRHPISYEERQRLLIEDLGISEEIVSQLPQDIPTPPPPGSRTAQEAQNPA